ncbi:hypothetical protein CC86DRAFT_371706 [Ophiobolus disseminans]|uniref:SnoaL-like domain-containing protein n=1 Tax=Ophiobolus disseminans TaxID=1469910 RepID=A0A6A6ZV56_9PLEO|nr:hypothetical protein CC86DRAFT_371706 [Ophiobolus disseminans]
MSDPMSQPPSASQTYKQLHNAALEFVDAQAQDPALPSRMNFDRIRAVTTSDFQHSWGHNYATGLNPRLQGTHSFLLFTKHLEAMLPNLVSWETTVTNVIVDEVKRQVVLRVSFYMVPKETEEGVENDLLWVLEMARDGEKWKIRRSKEFIDVAAAGRLKEIMTGGKTQRRISLDR